jgi:hypothetical protein
MKPNFIGVGAQKCASSWVYDILKDHPQAALSDKKELDFFSYHYEHGFDWYERQFALTGAAVIVGEISPSYFHDPRAPERVKNYNSAAKIVVTLRDPVERALSQHRHEVRVGAYLGPDFTFEAGLAQNPTYIEQGLYGTHLARWLGCFPQEQLLCIFQEDIKASPEMVAQQLYKFLAIDTGHQSAALYEKSNPSYAIKNRKLDDGIRYFRKLIRKNGLGWAWETLAKSPLKSYYRSANRTTSETVIPNPQIETIKHLRSLFQPDIIRLEALTAKDLATWREGN